jgi:hypothetical protein
MGFWGPIRSWLPVLLFLGLAALVIIIGVALWEIPQRQVPSELTDPMQRAELENQFRTTLAQIIAGASVLVGTNLTGAELIEANLTEANLFGANLEGANLSNARGLAQEQLNSAIGEPSMLPGYLRKGETESGE